MLIFSSKAALVPRSEIYYPTIDRPQIRDLQFLISDGKTFVHEEKRHLRSEIQSLSHHALGFRVTNTDPEERYRIIKEVIGDPHQDAVLIHTKIEGDENFLRVGIHSPQPLRSP